MKKAKKGVTTNRTKRKRTETDPEASEVYQRIRGMLEVSDANFICAKIDLTKRNISENQNRFYNFLQCLNLRTQSLGLTSNWTLLKSGTVN